MLQKQIATTEDAEDAEERIIVITTICPIVSSAS